MPMKHQIDSKADTNASRKHRSAAFEFAALQAKASCIGIFRSRKSMKRARAGGRARFPALTIAAPTPSDTSERLADSVAKKPSSFFRKAEHSANLKGRDAFL